jgi:hypothetical protein
VGGVSWSESDVGDDWGSEAKLAAANAKDTEQCWEDLVDDPKWFEDGGRGSFSFLDPVGHTYYIAPAMIRCCRAGEDERVCSSLDINDNYKRKNSLRYSARCNHRPSHESSGS